MIIGCTKEDSELRLSDFGVPTIRGYNMRDLFGDYAGTVGTPNIKPGDGADYYFVFYPNPVEDFCSIYIKTPASNELKKLWITPANFDNNITNSSINLNNANNIVIGGSPVFQTEFTNNKLTLNLSQVSDGYYRIYLEVDNYLLYDNLVIYKLIEY